MTTKTNVRQTGEECLQLGKQINVDVLSAIL